MPMLAGDRDLNAVRADNGSRNAPSKRRAISVSLAGLMQILAQHDELVTRQPGQAVPRAKHRGQPLGHRHQQLITDPMAVGVVDRP